jgi:hypothetical protein
LDRVYWAWWIAWRRLRQFVLAFLAVARSRVPVRRHVLPAGFCTIWLALRWRRIQHHELTVLPFTVLGPTTARPSRCSLPEKSAIYQFTAPLAIVLIVVCF